MTPFLCLVGLTALSLPASPEAISAELRKTTSLEIGYTVKGTMKFVTVTDAKQVNEIVGTITVVGTDNGLRVGLFPSGRLNFTMPNNTVAQTIVVGPGHLENAHCGQIYLKDAKFYKKINEVASKAEGKPIDILENN